jgi:hypothetical protein
LLGFFLEGKRWLWGVVTKKMEAENKIKEKTIEAVQVDDTITYKNKKKRNNNRCSLMVQGITR